MNELYLILLILAAVSFGAAAFNLVATARVNLVALGLLFMALVPLIQNIDAR